MSRNMTMVLRVLRNFSFDREVNDQVVFRAV